MTAAALCQTRSMVANLAALLDDAVARTPDSPALVEAGTGAVTTWSALADAVGRSARGLVEAGLVAGHRVALCLGNTPDSLIVKADDVGLHLAKKRSGAVAAVGRLLVRAMPRVLAVLSTVGIAAMLWVGGHILLQGTADLGWHALYDVVHHLEEAVAGVAGVGGFLAWCVNTLASALVGVVVGAVVVGVLHLVPRRGGHGGTRDGGEHEGEQVVGA